MDIGSKGPSSNVCVDAYPVTIAETAECFICRDVQLVDGEPLRRFCDCKNLVAHHSCLLTWVTKGLRCEDKSLRCSVCNSEYQRQRRAPWWTVASQWQVWPVVTVAMTLVALVPYGVHRMLTAFENPSPPALFRTAAVCFGLIAETLLVRCLCCYVCRQYRQAEQISFSLQPRSLGEEQEAMTTGVKGHGQQAEMWDGRSRVVSLCSQKRSRCGCRLPSLCPWKSRPVGGRAKQIDSL